ncbi:cytidylate kinase-like family protein [uncultured Tolumonas sp.]|uniref:cytidylate kinase-like family protein n=1 Tax=uncultured Tolumonas sp. TaxID=263765 RepID=UPI00292E48F3|nr:cytidylate kinase-like family protein [uncultured Tolumonas sp.]
MTTLPAITISRSLGSGGAQVGAGVARQLGWRFCDRRILREAARSLGVDAASLRCQEERPCGFLQQLLNLTAFATPEVPFVPPFEAPVYSAELFEAERTVMRRFADAGPSVLVGRGGFAALKDRPNALHVRIHADLEHRVHWLLDHGKAEDEAAARAMILQSDRERHQFFRKVLHLEWDDASPFGLVLDSGRLGLDGCVQALLAEAKARLVTE